MGLTNKDAREALGVVVERVAEATVDELWHTLDDIDWLASMLDADEYATSAILRAVADYIRVEAHLHDGELDRLLRLLIDGTASE